MIKHILTVAAIMMAAVNLQAKGLLISVVGISGSGKSTTFKELQKLIPGSLLFNEGEASEWPELVNQRALVGQFTFITTFRNIWDMQIKKAVQAKEQGEIALVDHYYGKIWYNIIGRPDSEWIIDPKDPYFPVFKQLATLDAQNIPEPDILIFLETDYKTYRAFLEKRSRWLDKNRPYESIFKTQEYIKEAVEKLKNSKGVQVITVKQGDKSPVQQAEYILAEITATLS